MFSAFPAEMCFEFPLVLLADLKESKLFDERDVSEKFNVSETFSLGCLLNFIPQLGNGRQ